MARAAAVAGDASSVREPRPCRPSKLRLLVLTASWPRLDQCFEARNNERRHAAAEYRLLSKQIGLGLLGE